MGRVCILSRDAGGKKNLKNCLKNKRWSVLFSAETPKETQPGIKVKGFWYPFGMFSKYRFSQVVSVVKGYRSVYFPVTRAEKAM